MSIEDIKRLIDEYLNNYFIASNGENKLIYDAMAYSLNIGGKRIRPIIMMLTYNLYKENFKDILPMAAALEMIHTYSLIHDDLPCMDNDDLRRGKPTSHKVFGEAMAVLAGDGLLNEAFSIMINYSISNNRLGALEATKVITDAAGGNGMIGGQVVDIINEGRSISESTLKYMHEKKTGELIKAAIVSGAILGEATEEDIDTLKEYGYKLGLAFQIKDDILDVLGSTEKLGKKVKSDENNNKTNFITVYGIEKSEELCKEITAECLALLEKLNRDTSKLKELTLELLHRES
ncbi:polyprenyl synthetase family protein [Clostridium folliculivorans]|uniref:Farnesyl diphosphate synthase n=1 Tax=Clostridium folliculivorans TaxID=2886038 RepID=A0A9W6D9K9_9CLOT|nr:farnesyl diphosphate synthase [Clostridium folliculivorans]GKU24001.1 geranyltranstransferase [Clostridium folliculivorans]GKU30116.1 geranyltranstransferase [Clostridium folliculivorans]